MKYPYPNKKKRISLSLVEGDVSVNQTLYKKDPLPSYEFLKQTSFSESQQSLFIFLKTRPRSRWECQKKLEELCFIPCEINFVLDFFQQQGWIDDHKFAQFLLEGTQTYRAKGSRAIRDKLREKGISKDIIDLILEKYGEENFLLDGKNLLQKQEYRFSLYEGNKKREKIQNYLYNRGFSSSQIEKILREQ